MELSPHVEALRTALAASGGEDPRTAAVAERLADAVAPALHLQLLDLLGEIALEVSDQLPDGRLDVQLAGRDAVLVYRDDPTATGSSAGAGRVGPASATDGDDAGSARLTVRMPEALKTAVERAADDAGQSTNAWLVAAARRALDPTPRRRAASGNRLTGYAQA